MDTTIRRNRSSKKGIACVRCSIQELRQEILKYHFASKSNLTGTVTTNPPQTNCSVFSETHYGSFMTGSTLANHLRVFD